MIRVVILVQLILPVVLAAQNSNAIQPNAQRTPGKPNPDINQNSIARNICSKKWSTDQVRPPSSYTSKLKLVQMQQYGDTVGHNRKKCLPGSNNPKCYEEDHLISLEVGGHPTDPENLWPEPYYTTVNGRTVGAKQKDLVEGFIHDEICFTIPHSRKNAKKFHPHSAVTLRRGQEILAKDWFACYQRMVNGQDCK